MGTTPKTSKEDNDAAALKAAPKEVIEPANSPQATPGAPPAGELRAAPATHTTASIAVGPDKAPVPTAMPELAPGPFAAVGSEGMVRSTNPDVSGETVTMVFPQPVTLTLDHHHQINFKAGIQEVPVELKNHIYLRANGVVPYDRAKMKGGPAGAEFIPSRKQYLEAGYTSEAYDQRYGTSGREV